MKQDGLRFGPIGSTCAHLCVDMQRVFAESEAWRMDWFPKVLPNIVQLVEHHPERTIFTQFIPLQSADEGNGAWKRYYQRWESMTLEHLDPSLVDLAMPLPLFCPPALTVQKRTYSPWLNTPLHQTLQEMHINTLIISGGETDVCIAATAAGAIDLGYRVILVTDALCSSSDQTHDAIMEIYRKRFSMQVELVCTEELLEEWARS